MATRQARSAEAQLTLLDERLGAGVGAHKERARLQSILQAAQAKRKQDADARARKQDSQNAKNKKTVG